jgi:hypothetical protein
MDHPVTLFWFNIRSTFPTLGIIALFAHNVIKITRPAQTSFRSSLSMTQIGIYDFVSTLCALFDNHNLIVCQGGNNVKR